GPGAGLDGGVGPLLLHVLARGLAVVPLVARDAGRLVLARLAIHLVLLGERGGGLRGAAGVAGARPDALRRARRHALVQPSFVEVGAVAAEDLVEEGGRAHVVSAVG